MSAHSFDPREPAGTDHKVLGFQLRIVRFGVQAQWLVMLVFGGYVLFAQGAERGPGLWGALIAGGSVTVITSLLPWARVLEQRGAIAVLVTWSVTVLLSITLLVHVTGGGRSSGFLFYGVTAVFSAAIFPLVIQTVMLLLTYTFYAGILWIHDFNLSAADLLMRLGFLAVVTFLAGHLSRELLHQKEAHLEANEELARRAELLATVA
ncbi:MAG: hypothetical protein ABI571_07355, partial [Actinomycetota bacterium]